MDKADDLKLKEVPICYGHYQCMSVCRDVKRCPDIQKCSRLTALHTKNREGKNETNLYYAGLQEYQDPGDKFFDSPRAIRIYWGVLIFAILYVAWLVLQAGLKHF